MEVVPLERTPKRSRGKPSESTIVARTVMVPSLAMAALWIFTTIPVLPRAEVPPLSWAGAAKSTGRLARTPWSSADAMLNNTTGARASSAPARCFLMDHSLILSKYGLQILFLYSRLSSKVGFGKGETGSARRKKRQALRNSLHMWWMRTTWKRMAFAAANGACAVFAGFGA